MVFAVILLTNKPFKSEDNKFSYIFNPLFESIM